MEDSVLNDKTRPHIALDFSTGYGCWQANNNKNMTEVIQLGITAFWDPVSVAETFQKLRRTTFLAWWSLSVSLPDFLLSSIITGNRKLRYWHGVISIQQDCHLTSAKTIWHDRAVSNVTDLPFSTRASNTDSCLPSESQFLMAPKWSVWHHQLIWPPQERMDPSSSSASRWRRGQVISRPAAFGSFPLAMACYSIYSYTFRIF